MAVEAQGSGVRRAVSAVAAVVVLACCAGAFWSADARGAVATSPVSPAFTGSSPMRDLGSLTPLGPQLLPPSRSPALSPPSPDETARHIEASEAERDAREAWLQSPPARDRMGISTHNRRWVFRIGWGNPSNKWPFKGHIDLFKGDKHKGGRW